MKDNLKQATLSELVDIRYHDEVASILDKAKAEMEIIRRQREERKVNKENDFLACSFVARPIIGD